MHTRLPYVFLLLLLTAVGCTYDRVPKPKAYPRIHFPVNEGNIHYHTDNCPYSFDLPGYYRVERKTTFFDEEITDACWLNIVCDSLNATLYLSYKELGPDITLMRLMEEAYELTYKHTNKADYIKPREFDNGHGSVGLIYYVGGDAASNIQFFLTDTTTHFVRGALYFYARPNADSLRPVVDFMIHDLETLTDSWRWE